MVWQVGTREVSARSIPATRSPIKEISLQHAAFYNTATRAVFFLERTISLPKFFSGNVYLRDRGIPPSLRLGYRGGSARIARWLAILAALRIPFTFYHQSGTVKMTVPL